MVSFEFCDYLCLCEKFYRCTVWKNQNQATHWFDLFIVADNEYNTQTNTLKQYIANYDNVWRIENGFITKYNKNITLTYQRILFFETYVQKTFNVFNAPCKQVQTTMSCVHDPPRVSNTILLWKIKPLIPGN